MNEDYALAKTLGLLLVVLPCLALLGARDTDRGVRRLLTLWMLMGTAMMLLGIASLVISMSVIGVHGIMSGTSAVDFGGAKNGGAAVGIVDGLVYLGTALQSFSAGYMTPTGDAAKDPSNWIGWPAFLVPFAILGLLLSFRIWNAPPRKK